jgi:two-component system chemotaxis sensor kinase CheA
MDQLQQRLMRTFLGELDARVKALNRDLLALETDHDPASVNRNELFQTLFRTAHSLKGAAAATGTTMIETACHQLEEIFGAARDHRLPLNPDLFQLLFASADAIQDAGRRLEAGQGLADAPLARLTSQLHVAAAGMIGAESARVPPALSNAEPRRPARREPANRPEPERRHQGSFVRIPAERLDALLVQSGELLVAQRRAEARLEDIVGLQELAKDARAEWRSVHRALGELVRRNGASGVPALPDGVSRYAVAAVRRAHDNIARLAEAVERLGVGIATDRRALEQVAVPLYAAMRHARMLPFGEACEGLERAARDLSQAVGKQARIIVEGGDIELDRSILEGLRDPLLHLVRNAIDHGIELPEQRRAAGKTALGRIEVSAALRGTTVEVVVADDGAGLNLSALREQARSRGLPDIDAQNVTHYMFLPGFSTARMITEVSGRGVGLDAVKTSVEAMNGTVHATSEPGRGARFTLILPLTLTAIRALLVAAGGQTFALDVAWIARLLRVEPGDLRTIDGREMLLTAGAPVPITNLAELLGLPPSDPAYPGTKRPVVLLAAGHLQAAFAVDELIDEQEAIVRNLGPRLRHVRYVAGATMLPSGRIALILNLPEMIRGAHARISAPHVASRIPDSESEARPRLLLVDDSVTTRALERNILESAGYEVLAAVDGAEAWQLLQEQGADLVVSDVDMPRMDGFALTEAIRGSRRFKDLPVVLVTARETEPDKIRGLHAGANAYLPKSAFDQQALLDTIEQLL